MHRYHDENKEHYASKHLQYVPKVRPPIAEHAATMYTRIIFNMFEDEVLESLWLTKEKLEKNSSSYTYLVFVFKDILCRHILMIFIKKCIL
jgi:hypothetical protein